MAQDRKSASVAEDTKADIERMNKRLDNMDSMITAIAERVMKEPITLNITCSKCGQSIEIALLGLEKPRK